MARGRMLNCKISRNRAVAELATRTGAVGVLVYTWMIPHLDADGRIYGDPGVLKGLVCPRITDVTPSVIADTLDHACSLGLVRRYDVDGEVYVEFPTFAANQIGLRKDRERSSDIPPPVDGVDPDTIRTPSGPLPEEIGLREGNLKEENTKEGKAEPRVSASNDQKIAPVPLGSPAKIATTTPKVVAVFDAWRARHPDHHLTPHSGLKEWRAVEARLSEGITVEQLVEAIDGIHKDDWKDRPRNLTLLNAVKSSDAVHRFRSMVAKDKSQGQGRGWQEFKDDD